VNHTAHDGLGKNVKQVRAHRQDPFDTGTHQGRCNDKTAAGTDTAGDQSCAQTDKNRDNKNARAVKRRAVSLFAPQNVRQGFTDLIGKNDATDDNRYSQQAEY